MEYSQDATVAQLDDFDEVIDVRSPSEFALDHVPGAVNCPVLDDAERARVGTLYKQVSPFEAKRVGAVLVARSIARHIESRFHDRPRHWRPLVYCWRGGARSDAMCEILRRVGWRAARLHGGYRAFRRAVLDDLERLPAGLSFRVVCGRTGTGKSRVLAALGELGAQVLDLEQLARHRGSVLGELPGSTQPSQKQFESELWDRMRRFDPRRPVFVEAESRKVGNVQVPAVLIGAMRASACIVLLAPMHVRIALLMHEYRHFMSDSVTLAQRLCALTARYGKETIERWTALARQGEHPRLVEALLEGHYDPAYDRSIQRNFRAVAAAPRVSLEAPSPEAAAALAREIMAECAPVRVVPGEGPACDERRRNVG